MSVSKSGTSSGSLAGTQEITPHTAAALLDALTDIVSRAAAATLARPFTEVAMAHQERSFPGDQRR